MSRTRALGGWAVLLLAGLLLTPPGCRKGTPSVEPARAVAPPPGWTNELAAERDKKDRFFRNDPGSPLADSAKASFKGLGYYPPDPAWFFRGRLAIASRPEPMTIAGSMGEQRTAERWAAFTFLVDGRPRTLQVYRLFEPGEREGHPYLPFLDETTGRETYPAGRYVEPDLDGSGSITVDFNRAYYPWCAYGKNYDCPLVPAENRLDVAILAGERGGPTSPPSRPPPASAGPGGMTKGRLPARSVDY